MGGGSVFGVGLQSVARGTLHTQKVDIRPYIKKPIVDGPWISLTWKIFVREGERDPKDQTDHNTAAGSLSSVI